MAAYGVPDNLTLSRVGASHNQKRVGSESWHFSTTRHGRERSTPAAWIASDGGDICRHRAGHRPRARPHRPRYPGRRNPRGQAGGGRAAGLGCHPHTERSAILRRAANSWLANAAEIESWVDKESGKIGGAAAFETHNSTQEIYEAATLPGQPCGELLPSEQPRLSFAERVPVGVVGVISPFNFRRSGHPLGRPGARARQRGGAQAGPAHLGLRRRRPCPGVRGGPCPRGCCTCCPAVPTPARR